MSEGSPIRLLGISGSPRKKATDYIVNEALRYAQEKFGCRDGVFLCQREGNEILHTL